MSECKLDGQRGKNLQEGLLTLVVTILRLQIDATVL